MIADMGYAVFVTNSITGQPVAIFAYPGEAEKWANANYRGRSRVAPIRWAPCDESRGSTVAE